MFVRLDMPQKMRDEIWAHLLPNPALTEEAGFGFAQYSRKSNFAQFSLIDWFGFQESDFDCKEGDYLSLKDDSRARLIKHAFITDTCIIEFHSHPFPYPAKFSFADKYGLDEFVPHLWWRLKHRPYMAVVVAPEDFDGIAWIDTPTNPIQLEAIRFGQKIEKATGLSLDLWR